MRLHLSAPFVRFTSTSALLVFAVVFWGEPILGQGLGGGPEGKAAPTVYKPIPADFKPEYLHDATNRRSQTWDQYWGWVTSYYQGNLLSNGWIKETEASLVRVNDPARRAELLKEMNEAGRLVGREWAKDGAVRKINTSDLIAWGNRLKTARGDDKGGGVELLATVRLIHNEAKQKIAGKAASKPMTAGLDAYP